MVVLELIRALLALMTFTKYIAKNKTLNLDEKFKFVNRSPWVVPLGICGYETEVE